jgi:hypothetical protein
MINKNQGAKQVENFKNIQSRTRAWPFKLSKYHQGFI